MLRFMLRFKMNLRFMLRTLEPALERREGFIGVNKDFEIYYRYTTAVLTKLSQRGDFSLNYKLREDLSLTDKLKR